MSGFNNGVSAATIGMSSEKPSFMAGATTSGNIATVSITNGVNIDHVAVLGSGTSYIGDMTGSGSSWNYTINNLNAGTYTYFVMAYSIPTPQGRGYTDTEVTTKLVSVTVLTGNVISEPIVNGGSGETVIGEKAKITTTEYGVSGEGRPLNVISIVPVGATSSILAVFEIHGFEDDYAHDGWALVNIGNKVVDYFSAYPEKLNGKALYVVVSANPDGVSDGYDNNAVGRCQESLGVDINRDFDYCWIPRYNTRNKTLSPFSCPESRALRDLVINLRPDDVVDTHGWMNTTYGTPTLDRFFENCIGIGRSGGLDGASGYFSAWARSAGYCQRSALVELPSPYTDPQNVINAFINLCANYYF
jgi:hypothetical protein